MDGVSLSSDGQPAGAEELLKDDVLLLSGEGGELVKDYGRGEGYYQAGLGHLTCLAKHLGIIVVTEVVDVARVSAALLTDVTQ